MGLAQVFMRILCIVKNISPIRVDTVLVYGASLMKKVKNEYPYNDCWVTSFWKEHVV